MSDLGGGADLDADEVARLRGGKFLFGAVEPTEVSDGIGWTGVKDDLAAGLEAILQRERPDAVRVIAVKAAAPDHAADFSRAAAGEVRLFTVAELVRAGLFGFLIG